MDLPEFRASATHAKYQKPYVLGIYNAICGSWSLVLRDIYLITLTGQK